MAHPFTKLVMKTNGSKFIHRVAVATKLGSVELWVNQTALIRGKIREDLQRRPSVWVDRIADEAKSRVTEELARRVPQIEADWKREIYHAIIGTGQHDGQGKTIDQNERWTIHLLDKFEELVEIIHVTVNAAEQCLSDLTIPKPRKNPTPPGSPKGERSLEQDEEYSPESKGKEASQ